jgi:hypothetical protein
MIHNGCKATGTVQIALINILRNMTRALLLAAMTKRQAFYRDPEDNPIVPSINNNTNWIQGYADAASYTSFCPQPK